MVKVVPEVHLDLCLPATRHSRVYAMPPVKELAGTRAIAAANLWKVAGWQKALPQGEMRRALCGSVCGQMGGLGSSNEAMTRS